jgi:hypothetical protein
MYKRFPSTRDFEVQEGIHETRTKIYHNPVCKTPAARAGSASKMGAEGEKGAAAAAARGVASKREHAMVRQAVARQHAARCRTRR